MNKTLQILILPFSFGEVAGLVTYHITSSNHAAAVAVMGVGLVVMGLVLAFR